MIKKLLILCIGLLVLTSIFLACAIGDSTSPLDRAISKWSRQYDVDPLMFKGICHVESGHMRSEMKVRNDWGRLHTQAWAVNAFEMCRVNGNKLNKDDGWNWASLGDSQILYIVAVAEYGYQGTPMELMNNVETNIKYGIRHFSTLRNRYLSNDDAISSYNSGKPRKWNGVYYNQRYVNAVIHEYNLLKE